MCEGVHTSDQPQEASQEEKLHQLWSAPYLQLQGQTSFW